MHDLPTVTIWGVMDTRIIAFPPRIAHLVNPAVLEQVAERITEREEAEAASSYLYDRYLQLHADHILSEVTRREHGNSPAPNAHSREAA
jgi:hypothetical protein